MIIEPKVRGYICATAHPDGCYANVVKQINYTRTQHAKTGIKNVLVIGCSTGYGLASRITTAYTYSANTLGVMYEKPAKGNRTATAGWYNTAAFETEARKAGLYAATINGDAFSKEVKLQTIKTIKQDLGKVDLVIYSLAAPRRKMEDGTTYTSVLKTTTSDFTNKSLNLRTNEVESATISPATDEELTSTVKVMGGEDWFDWISMMTDADVLSEKAMTIAYSYIGPKLTYPVYHDGTIGHAKDHLYKTSDKINTVFGSNGIKAYISVNKALVTQASSAIPIVPLYICLLYRVMKRKHLHEDCIMQINRLFQEKITDTIITDEKGRIRMDDYEMQDDIQSEIETLWAQISTENVHELTDIDGYWNDFYSLFGFRQKNVDYSKDADPVVNIPSIQ